MNYTGSRACNALQTPTIQGTMESNFFMASKAADMGNSTSEGLLDLHFGATGQVLSSHTSACFHWIHTRGSLGLASPKI